mgnify:CR=1 FL=1
MILFAAEDASLHYAGSPNPTFRNVTLRIKARENLRLCGPSGAGKTSLMRLIAGLEAPTSGKITAHACRIGYCFSEPRLLANLSVLENLLFVAPGFEAEAEDLLRCVEMEAFRDNPARNLSKGQAQRIALLRALIVRPDIVLLDEALGGLDLPAWQHSRKLVIERRATYPFALVEISHDPTRLVAPHGRTITLT